MNSQSAIPKLPQDIAWELGKRSGRITTGSYKLASLRAYHDYANRRNCSLVLAAASCMKAGFRPGDRVIMLHGRKPNNQWLRLEKTEHDAGVLLKSDTRSVSMSIGRFIRSDIELNEEIPVIITDGALYFELNKRWVES
jgi:hypothetical protein